MAAYDVAVLGSGLEFDTVNAEGICATYVPGTDWLAVRWFRSTTVINVQLFLVNRSTGALSAVGSPLDVEAGTAGGEFDGSVVAINASNLLVTWAGPGDDGFAQLISVDGSGNCTLNGSPLEFDTGNGAESQAILWDSTHVLVVWTGVGNDGFAQILTFNTGAGTIVGAGSAFEFDNISTTGQAKPGVCKLTSSKAVVFYAGVDSDGFAVVLDIDGSYNVTAAGSAFEYKDATEIIWNSPVLISSGATIVVANVHADSSADVFARTFNINTTTWAITAFGSELTIATTASVGRKSVGLAYLFDTSTLVIATSSDGADAMGHSIGYDSGTGALTVISSATMTTSASDSFSLASMGSNLYVATFRDVATADGFMWAFTVASGVAANTKSFFMFLDRR